MKICNGAESKIARFWGNIAESGAESGVDSSAESRADSGGGICRI